MARRVGFGERSRLGADASRRREVCKDGRDNGEHNTQNISYTDTAQEQHPHAHRYSHLLWPSQLLEACRPSQELSQDSQLGSHLPRDEIDTSRDTVQIAEY